MLARIVHPSVEGFKTIQAPRVVAAIVPRLYLRSGKRCREKAK